MIYDKGFSKEQALEHLNRLKNGRFEIESERYTDMGICYLVLEDYSAARVSFEKSYEIEPTEYVGRKLLYIYLKAEETKSLTDLLSSLCQHGFTPGEYSGRVAKYLFKREQFAPLIDLAKNTYSNFEDVIKFVYRAGFYDELLAIIDNDLDLSNEKMTNRTRVEIDYWVRIHALQKNHDAIRSGFKHASRRCKKAIADALYTMSNNDNRSFVMDILEFVYADSNYSDTSVANKLAKLYRANGCETDAVSLAQNILKIEIPHAYKTLNRLDNIVVACEIIGNVELGNNIKDVLRQAKNLIKEAEALLEPQKEITTLDDL